MLKHIFAMAGLLALGSAQAAVSLTDANFFYSQNFNTLTTGVWANDSTLPGWTINRQSGSTVSSYTLGDGSSGSSNLYSFGAAGSSDRALGAIATIAGGPWASGVFLLALTNNTGADLPGFKLHFDGEQWRSAATTVAQSLPVRWSIGLSPTSSDGLSWNTAASEFQWASNINPGAGGALARDGNGLGLDANIGGTVVTTWAAGSTLWLRWDNNANGTLGHGLAIDNVVLSAVPEPGNWALMLAGLGVVGQLARRRKG